MLFLTINIIRSSSIIIIIIITFIFNDEVKDPPPSTHNEKDYQPKRKPKNKSSSEKIGPKQNYMESNLGLQEDTQKEDRAPKLYPLEITEKVFSTRFKS